MSSQNLFIKDFFAVALMLQRGAIGVMPTDTIYGLVGSALSREVVERMYRVRQRAPEKPFIVLISSISDLGLFGVLLDEKLRSFLEKNWPGKVSVIISGIADKWKYLHRGTGSLAFRLPDKKDLLELISKTGPLVAPSANPEGFSPAKTIDEAKKYFGDAIDFYVDDGRRSGAPSELVKYQEGKFIVLRPGASNQI